MGEPGNLSSTQMNKSGKMKKRVFLQGIKVLSALLVSFFGLAPVSAQILDPGEPGSRLKPRPIKAAAALPPSPQKVSLNDPKVSAHLASYYSEGDALAGWDALVADFSSLLSPYQPILREIDLGARGRFVRLLAGPFEGQDDAAELCRSLRMQGAYCIPVDQAGKFIVSTEEWDG